MKTFLFIAAFIFSVISIACELQLPQHVLVLGPGAEFSPSMRVNNCTDSTQKEVNDILNSVEGKISQFQFAEMLRARGIEASITPSFVQVQKLTNVVREQLILPPGVRLESSTAPSARNYVDLNHGDQLTIDCSPCFFGSQQPLNINIRGFDGTSRSFTISADFKKMTKAYVLKTNLPAFGEIPPEALEEKYLEEKSQADYLSNIADLRFYKLNKPLRAGQVLRKHDLTAQSLVRAGMKTEVIIENQLVRVKSHGISRSNGSLGDFVEVFHTQKNKKYLGKVIDLNKVLVEL
jgi:flagella basal body P-ring formation protein FlgA